MIEFGASEMRVRALLSLQRALLGMVTPALRGVAVAWSDDRVAARFIYESDRSGQVELVQEVETEVLADFADDVRTEFSVEVAEGPASLHLAKGEVWAYRRREE